MRFFVVLFTFLILFQPASWAIGDVGHMRLMTMHGQLKADTGDNQMLENAPQQYSDTEQLSSLNLPCNSATADMQGDCFVKCVTACSAAAAFVTPAFKYFSADFKGVVLTALSISYTSYTESPEIQPPLEIQN